MLLVCIRSYLNSVMGNKFLNILPRYIYVSKDVKVRGYFSKPKGVSEQTRFGKHCSGCNEGDHASQL